MAEWKETTVDELAKASVGSWVTSWHTWALGKGTNEPGWWFR